MLRKTFAMLRTVVRATFNEGCCECVANVFRACCERGYVQHPTSGVFLPPPPHVATTLRPVFVRSQMLVSLKGGGGELDNLKT
jgi:hypothetical protein